MFLLTKLNLLWEKVKALEEHGTVSDLPDVDQSDVGKILTVGDSGEWEADDLPPQLPEVDQSDAGSFLAVDENGEWGLDMPAAGFVITDSEVDTGIKIGTNVIYAKKYSLNDSHVNTRITNDNILPLFAFAYRAGSTASNNGGQPIGVYRSYEGGVYLGEDIIQGFSGVGGKEIVIFYIK